MDTINELFDMAFRQERGKPISFIALIADKIRLSIKENKISLQKHKEVERRKEMKITMKNEKIIKVLVA